jgi:SAM-dependent MidA family methyltransferase
VQHYRGTSAMDAARDLGADSLGRAGHQNHFSCQRKAHDPSDKLQIVTKTAIIPAQPIVLLPFLSLPVPDTAAIAHSDRLHAHIAEAIRGAGGWIPFARYMELALYTPGLGYYGGATEKFGVAGDFVTAPELSPLFAQTLAVQVAELMRQSAAQIIEAGPGSGALAAELLMELERRRALPGRYALLELSGDLRARQRATLAHRCPWLAERVAWLDRLPAVFSGVVIANEVADAMPVQVIAWRDDGIFERGVALREEGGLGWQERPATGAVLDAARAIGATPPYVSEIGLAARAWVATWGEIMQRGAVLLFDYGFPMREYYHPQRDGGTLMCHYRHHAHADPLLLPGLNDITAHVDFSALADAGTSRGLELYGYASQAQFLLNCGLTDVLARVSPEDTAKYLRLAAGAQKLISPSEMGELFKVIALGRGIEEPLVGFAHGDRSHSL